MTFMTQTVGTSDSRANHRERYLRSKADYDYAMDRVKRHPYHNMSAIRMFLEALFRPIRHRRMATDYKLRLAIANDSSLTYRNAMCLYTGWHEVMYGYTPLLESSEVRIIHNG